jgi:hypothetical protein
MNVDLDVVERTFYAAYNFTPKTVFWLRNTILKGNLICENIVVNNLMSILID